MPRCLVVPLGILFLQFLFADNRLLAQTLEVPFIYPSQVTVGESVTAELIGKQADRIERLYFARPGIEAQPLGKGKAEITVVADVPIGDIDVWLASSTGLAAPVRMTVSEWPARTESEPNNTAAQAEDLELPVAVCGRIEPGTDGDWYRVRLNSRDGLTLACRSATLGGTLQPTLIVLDPQGREIAHDTLTRIEPVVHVEAMEPGAYTICVQDRSYRSTPRPFYQLSLTTGPWIVGAYPPTLLRGQTQQVTLYGYRLPMCEPCTIHGPLRRQTIEIVAPDAPMPAEQSWNLSRSLFVDAFEFRQTGVGGSARFELLDRPFHDAEGDTSSRGSAAAIRQELPFDVVNRFGSPREVVHWYRFTAQAGRSYWLEAVAERIERACDLELIVHDAAGKPLTTIGNFTTPKELAGELSLESRDPAGPWKATADGDYLLAVRDLLAAAGPVERAYRLSVGPLLEDVRVVAQIVKSSDADGWAVKAGGRLAISLATVRRGSHEGPIEIRAQGLPPGVKISPVTIATKKITAVLAIMADKDAEAWIGPIQLVATTEANGAPLTVKVRAATRFSPGTPAVSRLFDETVLAVLPGAKK